MRVNLIQKNKGKNITDIPDCRSSADRIRENGKFYYKHWTRYSKFIKIWRKLSNDISKLFPTEDSYKAAQKHGW